MKHLIPRNRALSVRARYDVAQTTDENRRLWAPADGYDADACNNLGVRMILRNRARYMYAKNSRAQGMVNTLSKLTVGAQGPRLQMLIGDGPAARKLSGKIEASFRAWSREVRLAKKLRIARIAKVITGEVFVALVINPKLTHPVKLDVQLIEADQVTNPAPDLVSEDVDGVFFDEYGNPEIYRVLRIHPGAAWKMISPNEYDDRSARFMRHYAMCDRPGQHRGIPQVTPAMQLIEEGRRFRAAVLGAAEVAADNAMALESDASAADPNEVTETGQEGEDTEIGPMDTLELKRRMATVLPRGFKLSQMKPEHPTTTYKEFSREILAEFARCLDMPISIASMDANDANMSSSYVINQPFGTAIEVEQGELEDEIIDPVVDAFLTLAFGGPEPIARRMPAAFPHTYFWGPTQKHADPSKLATARDTNLKNFTTTLAREWAAEGEDWEEGIKQIAKERALLRDLGLTLEQATPQPKPASDPDEDEEDDEPTA